MSAVLNINCSQQIGDDMPLHAMYSTQHVKARAAAARQTSSSSPVVDVAASDRMRRRLAAPQYVARARRDADVVSPVAVALRARRPLEHVAVGREMLGGAIGRVAHAGRVELEIEELACEPRVIDACRPDVQVLQLGTHGQAFEQLPAAEVFAMVRVK